MKKYVKTIWVDDKTPVDARHLNKIEDQLYFLTQGKYDSDSLNPGRGISFTQDKCGNIYINIDSEILDSLNVIKTKEDGFFICDSQNNVGFAVTSEGVDLGMLCEDSKEMVKDLTKLKWE